VTNKICSITNTKKFSMRRNDCVPGNTVLSTIGVQVPFPTLNL